MSEGICACGCGRQTKLVAGHWMPYFSINCHPANRKILAKRAEKKPREYKSQNWSPYRKLDQMQDDGDFGMKPSKKPRWRPQPVPIPDDKRLAGVFRWVEKNADHMEMVNHVASEKKRTRNNLRAGIYLKRRKQEDRCFNLLSRLRSQVRYHMKAGKKEQRTIQYLGCTIERFRKWIEGQFSDGMSWDNIDLWHLDHIRPCASFDLRNPRHFDECFHFTNYQPLWAKDNHKKGSLWNGVRHKLGKPVSTSLSTE